MKHKQKKKQKLNFNNEISPELYPCGIISVTQ